MAHPLTMVAGILPLLLLSLAPASAQAEDGKALFEKQCSSCHTIGGGDGAGPDLKGVGAKRSRDWLIRIITEPDKLAADKDPAQLELVKKYGMTMPSLGVSRDDAGKLVAFLQGEGGAASAAAPAPTAAPAPPPSAPVAATPELIAAGRALFTGQTRFSKGGAPCVACHNVRYPGIYGGALAGDLTGVYGGMGESGLRGVLKSLSFPVMRKIYAERPLTEPEANALMAFFQDASARKAAGPHLYPVTGLGCFAAFMVAALILKRRIR